jgi:O-antigen/teichoic acid export membrane protein
VSILDRLRSPALRNIAIYGISTGLAAALILVQTRVLWRALTPADFGIWALADPLMLPLACLVLFGIDQAIVKQQQADGKPLPVVVGALLTATVPATLLCLLVIGLVAEFAFHLPWTNALLLTVGGEALILMMQTAFRSTGATVPFAALLVSRNLLYLALLAGVRLVTAPVPLSVGTVFTMRGACVIALSLVAIAALRPKPRVDWTAYRDAVGYGFPLLITTFIYGVSDMTDRWFLAEFSGVIAVGVYSLHLKMAAIMAQAIVIPFGLWFPPERFRHINDPDQGHAFFKRTAAVVALVCAYLSGCVWLARDIVLPLIAPGIVASPLVLGCCLGGVTCLALSHAFNVGLLQPGHTSKNAYCTAYAVAATFFAACVLVPLFGMAGAAVSRLAGGVVLVTVTAVYSYRVTPIAFPFGRIFACFAAAIAVAWIINQIVPARGVLNVCVALIEWSVAMACISPILWIRVPSRGYVMPSAPPSPS